MPQKFSHWFSNQSWCMIVTLRQEPPLMKQLSDDEVAACVETNDSAHLRAIA